MANKSCLIMAFVSAGMSFASQEPYKESDCQKQRDKDLPFISLNVLDSIHHDFSGREIINQPEAKSAEQSVCHAYLSPENDLRNVYRGIGNHDDVVHLLQNRARGISLYFDSNGKFPDAYPVWLRPSGYIKSDAFWDSSCAIGLPLAGASSFDDIGIIMEYPESHLIRYNNGLKFLAFLCALHSRCGSASAANCLVKDGQKIALKAIYRFLLKGHPALD